MRENDVKIDKGAFVAVSYSLKLENGQMVEQTVEKDPLCFVFGIGRMMPGLEKGLQGMEAGNRATVTVEPEDAYGNARDDLVREFPREIFPDKVGIKLGDRMQAMSPQGPMAFEVKRLTDDKVLCDFNHPLAGKRLVFDLEVKEVRPSTPEDIAAMDSCECDTSACDDDTCQGCH